MSKQVEGIRRMLLILNKLRQTRKYTPKVELVNYVNDRMTGYYGYNSISDRTIERDICDIGELFGIYIYCCPLKLFIQNKLGLTLLTKYQPF